MSVHEISIHLHGHPYILFSDSFYEPALSAFSTLNRPLNISFGGKDYIDDQNLNIREGDSSWIWDIYVVLRLWLNARIW